jgi:uncharacterized protein
MQIKNLFINGNNANISVKIAQGFVDKLIGLMFSKKAGASGLILSGCNSIHTFFMFYSIDIFFLDNNNGVVKKIAGLKPWRIVLPVKNAVKVIEIPSHLSGHLTVNPGDILELT